MSPRVCIRGPFYTMKLNIVFLCTSIARVNTPTGTSAFQAPEKGKNVTDKSVYLTQTKISAPEFSIHHQGSQECSCHTNCQWRGNTPRMRVITLGRQTDAEVKVGSPLH